MKHLVTILSLMIIALPATAQAKNCESVDLVLAEAEILSKKDIQSSQVPLLMDMAANAKLAQILACVGKGESLSKPEADFATDRISKSHQARQQANLNHLRELNRRSGDNRLTFDRAYYDSIVTEMERDRVRTEKIKNQIRAATK